MAEITFKGTPVHTCGTPPEKGAQAPDFTLTQGDLSDTSLKDFAGSKLVLNIFPSIDTGVCAASVRAFNEKAASLENAKVLCISRDLPFAQARFCGAEGIENVTMLSEMRDRKFGENYGICLTDGPLRGLLSRVVIVLDGDGKIVYTQQVPEIGDEPDYDAALESLK